MSHDVNKFKVKNHFGSLIQVRLVWNDGDDKSEWLSIQASETRTFPAQVFFPRPKEGTHVWLQGKGDGVKDKSGESQEMRLSFDDNDWKAEFEALRRNNFKFQLSFRSFEED